MHWKQRAETALPWSSETVGSRAHAFSEPQQECTARLYVGDRSSRAMGGHLGTREVPLTFQVGDDVSRGTREDSCVQLFKK